jgi:hypothetical protein
MQELTPLDPWEKELRESLRSLSPGAGELSLREVWLRAGLLSARHRVRFWRGVAAAVVVIASIALFVRPRPRPTILEHYVYVPRSSVESAALENPPLPPRLPSSYLALRNAVETEGWRALETPAGQETPAGTTSQLPLRPIDEATPAFWAGTQNRG